jgi:uncharacterized RDD family membrane protein YckC
MNTDIKQTMARKTDEQLIKIVTVDRDGYEQIGIDAAEEELKNRNINQDKIEAVSLDFINKIKEETKLHEASPSTYARVINFIIDTIAFSFILAILSYFSGIILCCSKYIHHRAYMYIFMMALSFFSYYVLLETYYQKTLGKYLTKTHVRKKDGSKPTLKDILIRTCLRFVPFDSISFLFSINGFHDKLSDTVVVKDEVE